ncbi:hypothetical protein [Bosea vaviloviae]|uniref:Uncharacterized protein n=1 Tax=Bosea vaviloviae TaxID=1526658 RepID=A0A0N1F1F5_9HYPH|nr:hypothetical protein [Bosea vaviloviae]KPH77376.1 hypothetical protein AE618_22780 [Bosea vaviloviae]
MTTIGSTSYSAVTSRYAAVERSQSSTFADQIGQETASTTGPQSGKLATLSAELKELQRQQVNMSNRDYLLANLTLKEQVSTERLNAGEGLDVIGVRFEGRIFNLAGKAFGPRSLDFAKISYSDMVQLVEPEDKLGGNLAQHQTSIDIQL